MSLYQAMNPDDVKQVRKAMYPEGCPPLKSKLDCVKAWHDFDCMTHGKPACISLTQYRRIKQLLPLTVLGCMQLCSTADMCKALGCTLGKLNRTLKALEPHVRRMPADTGYVKTLTHPDFGMRGGSWEHAIQAFYKPE